MKRILLLTHTNRVAGAERMVKVLYESAQKKGLAIGIGVLSQNTEGRLLGAEANPGLKQILFGSYDVIHTHLFWPGFLVRLKRVWDSKFIWIHTVHYAQYSKLRWAHFKWFMDRAFIFPSPEHLVAVSPSVLRTLARFPNRILIENETSYLADHLEARIVCNRPKVILGTIAMLRAEKGLNDLLDMMAILQSRGFACELRVAGEGPARAALTARINKLGLNSEVRLLGYVNDVSEFLRDIDVYVNASHAESYGLALVEALHAGVPMIAAGVDHIPQLLGFGEFGKVIPRGSKFVTELSLAVEEVCRDLTAWSTRARQGYAVYLEQSQPMTSRYLALYDRALKRGVCMVAPVVTHSVGGIQKQMKLQSRELTRLGFNVYVLQQFDPDLSAERQLRAGWGHVQFLQVKDPFSWLATRSRFFLRLRGLSFVLLGALTVFKQRRRIHILHAHQLFSPTLLSFICQKLLGLPFIVKVTASGRLGESSQLREMPFFRLRRFAFRSISRAIVLTDEMRDEVTALGLAPHQITLLPNCVEEQSVTRRAQPPRTEGQPFQILYCGRLSSEKSLATLIEAGRLLALRGRAAHIRLIGGGHGGRDVTEELKAQTATLPTLVRVEFTGHLEELSAEYLNADAFVLPSTSEGMSNSLLEAMAYGLPCVASDIAANRFVLTEEQDGLLFQCENAESLCTVLERLILDPALADRLSENALKTVSRRFSPGAIAAQIASLYREAWTDNEVSL